MNRRKFIALAGGAAVGWPVAARAQQPSKAARIGMLGAGRSGNSPILNGFRDGLRLLGYVEGENIFLEHRFSEGHSEQYRALAKELVNLKVDVIVAPGTPEALAAKEATSTIPIVTVLVGDPIGSGLVVSLARPGGNITGMSSSATDTMAKQLELLKEVAPQVSHVAQCT
jgi:putative ABC transport system substrate-binding protein